MLHRTEEYPSTTHGTQSELCQQECFTFTVQEVRVPNITQRKMNVEPLPQT